MSELPRIITHPCALPVGWLASYDDDADPREAWGVTEEEARRKLTERTDDDRD